MNFPLSVKKALFLAASLTASSLAGTTGAQAEGFKSGVSIRSGDIGEGTSLSGFVFKPLTSREDGNLFYIDAYGSIIYDDSFDSDLSAALSSRLGFRSQNETGFGLNAGLDITPYGNETFAQLGFGVEYFNEKLKLDLTGAIPFEEGDFESYASGFIAGGKLKLNSQSSKSTLSTYELRGEYKVSDDKSLITRVYALDPLKDDYDTEVGIGVGAKFSKGNTSLTVEYSYDEIFDSTVSANLSISLGDKSRDSKGSNERLLAHRSGQVKVGKVKRTFTATDAIDASNLAAVEAVCIGSLGGSNSCSSTLNSTEISSNPDYIVVSNGTTIDLDLETTVADTLKLGANTTLTSVAEAPNIKTTLGTVKLSKFGSTSGVKPTFQNGTLSAASNTSIKGFNFENASIANHGTSNITVANNAFSGSINGEGSIYFDGATNVVITDNTITKPTTSALASSSVATQIGRGIAVKNGNNVIISDNTISGATAEGIYIENIGTSASNIIKGNTVSGMKASEDSNLEGGIFVRNDKDGFISITGNTVKDNNLTSGEGFPADRGTNSTDGIEVNICRGGVNLDSDAFTDGIAGACSSNATLTAVVSNNTVSNLQGGADGIDANIGDNGRLILTVDENKVTGVGDEGFTLDAFGANTQATVVITDNTLKTSGAKGTAPGEDGSTDGIAVTFQENVSDGDFTASGVYDFTITGNTIEADTDNLAGTLERGDKAEGIKFTINEGVKNGTTKLTAVIDDNDIKTRIGDGIEFAVNEKAADGVVFDADITINNNRIVQTNDNPVGSDNKDPRDLIKATFGEDGTGSITTGTFTITNNTVTSAAGAGDAFDYESLGTSSSNSFKFKIEGNNFSAADDKDLKIEIPAGFLGIYAPDGTTNFDAYLNSINTNAETEITGSPEVFRF